MVSGRRWSSATWCGSRPASIGDRDETNARFTYTVSDGNGHEVSADVSVSILRESVARPPYARDDSTFTTVDSPVTVDVLRNDGDPSGERPTLVGNPGCPAGGRAVVTADGQVRFDPPADRPERSAARTRSRTRRPARRARRSSCRCASRVLTNVPPVAVERLAHRSRSARPRRSTSPRTTPILTDRTAQLTVVSSTAPTLGTADPARQHDHVHGRPGARRHDDQLPGRRRGRCGVARPARRCRSSRRQNSPAGRRGRTSQHLRARRARRRSTCWRTPSTRTAPRAVCRRARQRHEALGRRHGVCQRPRRDHHARSELRRQRGGDVHDRRRRWLDVERSR